jgi:uncharacterized membrane protein YkvI
MWWRGIKIAMTIIGTTIGAGFASGREIWEFFSSYGPLSQWGVLLSMMLFWICSVIILMVSWEKRSTNYYQVLIEFLGEKTAKWFDKIVFFYLLCTVVVMFAGSGATFVQWKLPFWVGVAGMLAAVLFVLLYDVKGLLSINTFIIPVLTTVLLIVCIRFLWMDLQWSSGTEELQQPELTNRVQWPSAVVYASLNVVSLLAILSTIGAEVRSKGEIWIGAALSALILGAIQLLFNGSLIRNGIEMISMYEMPLFSLITDANPWLIFSVTVILWLAIYTTAVSGIYGVSYRLSERLKLPVWFIGLLLMLLILPLTQFGFTKLVQILYPLYGIINLLLLAMVIMYPIQKRIGRYWS